MSERSDIEELVRYAIKKACLYCWDEVPQGRFNAERANEIADELIEIIFEQPEEPTGKRRIKRGRRFLRANNTSGYRGVHAHGGKWITHCYGVYLGTFDTPEEAARAYDQAILERLGNSDCLNFPT